MSVHERYLYIECLMIQWRDGFLPDDFPRICRAIRCDQRQLRQAWHKVREQFPQQSTGKLVNIRLQSLSYEKDKRSQDGLESAKRRWQPNARASDSDSVSISSAQKGESEGETKPPRDPMQAPPGFEMFWSRYRALRDAGRRRPAIAVWLTCGCERRSDAVLVALTSYERSRDAKNGAVQNADKWLQAVFDSGFSISWPSGEVEAVDSRGNLPEWKGFTQ